MMGVYWWYITVLEPGDIPSRECEEVLCSVAEMTGCVGSELQELPQGMRMRIYYRSDEPINALRDRLLEALAHWPGITIEDIGKIENQPWQTQSEEAFPPLDVGEGFVVLAPWHRGKEPSGRTPLYINPGSAFGTGYHESTQTVLTLFERHVKRAGYVGDVIDIGTGSGILSIAALKLGASGVRARDFDPVAIDEVVANMRHNDVDTRLAAIEEGDLLSGVSDKFDLLFANILLEPLLRMLPDVPGVLKKGGAAIFSGMILKERGEFSDALAANGFSVIDEAEKEDWWGVTAQGKA
ncbi:ribosomal protein L11 methyltransferase [Synergistales bacterium]|nr:ribosomal protein L11 methyltransferase [Synergistales bacterium]